MTSQAEIRSLTSLVETASTARVLNLARLHRRGSRVARKLPLFRHASLDRAIILKHRLRPHERDWFDNPPAVATKVMIPIDTDDLRVGAHSFLVGQRGVHAIYAQALGVDPDPEGDDPDRRVLTALNELPTLDPFLTREHLKRRGVFADDAYFEISEADVARMFTFVRNDIVPLVTLCFGATANTAAGQAQKLAQKILAADMDATMDPLRLTLKMDDGQFQESIFCWKGFLYYKWVLNDSMQSAIGVAGEIENAKVRGKATPEEATYIHGARTRLQAGIKQACRDVRSALDSYDAAFAALTERADPIAFRDFLLGAPELFFGVGDRLGAVQHITSFWRYRKRHDAPAMTAPELSDILRDFENGLGSNADRQSTW